MILESKKVIMDDYSIENYIKNLLMVLPILIGKNNLFSSNVNLSSQNRANRTSSVVTAICNFVLKNGTLSEALKNHPRKENLESWFNIA